MWHRLIGLVIKELLAVWRDPKSRFALIVPPLIQIFVLSYAATYEVTGVTVAVLDRAGTLQSRELVARFAGSPAIVEVMPVANEAALGRAIDSRRADFAISLGPDFARRLIGDPPAEVQLVFDGRSSNAALILQGYAARILADLEADWSTADGAPRPPPPLAVRALYNANLESLWVVVPSLVGILSMLLALVVTALSVAREREAGTLEQLLVTPLRPGEILVGKTVPGLVVGLAAGSVMIATALVWFGVPLRGSLGLLYAGLAVFLLSVIGIGLFMSAIVQTQQQAILAVFLFMVPAVILSGFATPVENMPGWVQAITYLNPLRYFLVVVKGIFLKALPASLLLAQLWPMTLIGAATLAGAAWFFRRRLH